MLTKRPLLLKNRITVLLLQALLSAGLYAQPGQQQFSEITPGAVNPVQMTRSGFESFFKDNNQKNTKGSDKNKETPEIRRRLENKALEKDSTQGDSFKKSNYRPDDTYGAYVFANAAMNDISELSIPPPDYPIGVGDHIIVSLWGGGEYQEDYIVARDGAIFPSGLGKISVQGLTFENAQKLVHARFSGTVPPGTNIQITLGQPRTINVNVVGEVVNPGPKLISAFSNAYNAIGLAGGVTEYGNLREIEVKRAGRTIEVLDVYKYLTTGDIGKRVYLQNNDFIIVKFAEKRVLATGQFKRPMFYQLKKEEGIKALIKYAGGFTSEAFASAMKVIRTENERQVLHDVNGTAIVKLLNQDFELADGDIVKVDMIKPGIINKVELAGAVVYPGVYEIRTNDRLFDVINRAGGITNTTYLPRAYIFRGAGDSTNIKSDKLEVNLTDYQNDDISSVNNVLLQPNDVIQLFSTSDFADQQFVYIDGEVRKEGKVRKYGGMTLQDLIYLSGGLKPSAEFGRLEIASIVDMDSAKQGLKPTRTVVRSYNISSTLELDSVAAQVLLRPYDQVHVRKNPTFSLQENIHIVGLVKYQGAYPRLDKYERLSSYIERAGGILDNANLGGAMLYRKKSDYLKEKLFTKPKKDSMGRLIVNDSVVLSLDQPVSIDLHRAMKEKGSKYDIILQENDIIYIPEVNPFVTVQGKVQSPLKIAFDKDHASLKYYIDKAGGFGTRPWRKRVFVTYANGRSKRTKNFFFIHFYPKAEEGCTITVPERPEGKDISGNIVQAVSTALPIVITYMLLRK
ncbi:MAG TPA: SLBB domain-containing protein [Ferruginibacter sp.]|nr:SLBB domain-containing protein [Ferruginibacter sp.]HMP19371.1 SLBB domain-containing protein [Ferruginibacter sp.]